MSIVSLLDRAGDDRRRAEDARADDRGRRSSRRRRRATASASALPACGAALIAQLPLFVGGAAQLAARGRASRSSSPGAPSCLRRCAPCPAIVSPLTRPVNSWRWSAGTAFGLRRERDLVAVRHAAAKLRAVGARAHRAFEDLEELVERDLVRRVLARDVHLRLPLAGDLRRARPTGRCSSRPACRRLSPAPGCPSARRDTSRPCGSRARRRACRASARGSSAAASDSSRAGDSSRSRSPCRDRSRRDSARRSCARSVTPSFFALSRASLRR